MTANNQVNVHAKILGAIGGGNFGEPDFTSDDQAGKLTPAILTDNEIQILKTIIPTLGGGMLRHYQNVLRFNEQIRGNLADSAELNVVKKKRRQPKSKTEERVREIARLLKAKTSWKDIHKVVKCNDGKPFATVSSLMQSYHNAVKRTPSLIEGI